MPQTFTAFGVFLHISAGIHHDLKSEVIITPSVFAPTAMFSGCNNSLMPIKVLLYPLALIISFHQRRATKSCLEIRHKIDLAADCKYPISVLKQIMSMKQIETVFIDTSESICWIYAVESCLSGL